MIKKEGKKAQIAIFVIVAIVLIGAVSLFFVLRDQSSEQINTELSTVYTKYSSCIEEDMRQAVDLAGTQGGRIYGAPYIPGSDYAPFSNQLNFMGFPVDYWYYISGNGVVKENIPTKSEMEREMADFI